MFLPDDENDQDDKHSSHWKKFNPFRKKERNHERKNGSDMDATDDPVSTMN